MTKLTPELLVKANATKSAKELLALAKESDVEMHQSQQAAVTAYCPKMQ